MEAGAAAIPDSSVRRLRCGALCPLRLHVADLPVPDRPCRAGASGAEEPARDDHRPLSFGRTPMARKRSFLIPGVDKRLLIKDAVKVMPDLTRRRFLTTGASLGALTLLTGCHVLGRDNA